MIDRIDLINPKPPGITLIGKRAINKTVAQDDIAFIKSRLHLLCQVLPSRCCIKKRLCPRIHCRILCIQDNSPDLLSDFNAARLPRLHHFISFISEPARQHIDNSRLAGSLRTFRCYK
ncbi:Uncharacterised protein [Mycobacteroides abscessus subsp. abscessus]|nr:Uncharacterised protein [Mycobacteroides abscessus subsp. abscessus]